MSSIKVTNLQHASAASPAIVLASDGTATAQLSSLNSGPLAGMRNRLINGNFDFWQRGTSLTFSATGPYLADRWAVGGGTSTTVSRQSFTVGQTDVPGEPTYFLRWDMTSNSQNYEAIQKVEDVRTLAGQQATLSFYARRTSGTVTVNARFVQDFGTGGSPSSVVVTSAGTPSLTTSWQKFTYTVTLPSISGKTLGSDNNSSLWVGLQVANTGTGVIELAQFQLEAGSVATPFERRSYGQELALCQRYFQRGGAGMTGWYNSSTNCQGGIVFPVEMRSSPTATFLGGSIQIFEVGVGAFNATALAGQDNYTTRGILISLTTSGATANGFMATPYNVVSLSSEL